MAGAFRGQIDGLRKQFRNARLGRVDNRGGIKAFWSGDRSKPRISLSSIMSLILNVLANVFIL